MSKHTPGPWFETVVPTSAGSAINIQSADHRIAIIYVDGIRKGIDDELPRSIQNRANARLIAAAPELLEVALLQEEANALFDKQGATATYMMLSSELHRKRRDAIAKATNTGGV